MQGKGKINAEGLELGILLCLLSRNKGLFSIAWLNWNAKICDTYFSIIILSFLTEVAGEGGTNWAPQKFLSSQKFRHLMG